MKIYGLLLLLLPSLAFSESNFDKNLKDKGIVDSSYKIINQKAFDELMRLATAHIAPMLPARIDSVTTALGMNLNKFGVYAIYQIDDIETKDEARNLMENQGLNENYKNYMCSLDYSQSLVFRNNGNMSANVTLVNSKNQVLYNFKVPFRDCV
jgi:hypothetical protein